MNSIFYIFSFITLTYGFPAETTNFTTNTTKPPSSSLVVKRQFSKPRIYRSNPGFMSPINPMENLLLYLLLSAGKDFEDDFDMHDRKRSSSDLLSDAMGDIAVAAGNLMNGTKKIEGPRESFTDLEIRSHPIAQEGTCMCFNRIFRTHSNSHFEPLIHPRFSKEKSHKFKIPELKEKESDEAMKKDLDLNMESTSERLGSSVRILRVSDLVGEEKATEGSKGTETKSDLDMILELDQTSQSFKEDGIKKKNGDVGGPPPWLETIKSPIKRFSFTNQKPTEQAKELLKSNETDNKPDDDGYYFLFYSGGTENRTTANDVKRELKNGLPNFLRKLQNVDARKEEISNEERAVTESDLQMGYTTDSNDTGNSTLFPLEDDDYEHDEHVAPDKKIEPNNTYLYSVSIPTAICILLLVLAICLLAKPTGRFCEKFLRNPQDPTSPRVVKFQTQESSRGSRSYRASQDDLDEVEKSSRRVPIEDYQKPRKHFVAFGGIERTRSGDYGSRQKGYDDAVDVKGEMQERKDVPFGDAGA